MILLLYILYLITYTYYLVKIFILYFRKLYYELWISMCRYLLWSILGLLKITINHYESLFINHYEWLLITHSWLIVSITQKHPNHQPSTFEKPPGVGRGGPGLDLRFLGVAHGAGRRGRGTRTRGAVVPWATGRCHGMGRNYRKMGYKWWINGGHLGENMVDPCWINGYMVDILGKTMENMVDTWWIYGGHLGEIGFFNMLWLDFVDVSLFHPVGASNEMGRRLSTPTSTTWPRSWSEGTSDRLL